MTKELYRSFEGKLGVDQRSGYIISALDNGNLRVKTLSVYNDEDDYTYYVKPTADYNSNTNWIEQINDYNTTAAQAFIHALQQDEVKAYRIVRER
jgi:hypothetical protein